MRPRREVKNIKKLTNATRTWQTWHERGELCPEGTIPMRRTTVDDVLRAKSLYHFGKKQSRSKSSLAKSADPPDITSGFGHEVPQSHTITFHLINFPFSFQYFRGCKLSIISIILLKILRHCRTSICVRCHCKCKYSSL